ncbi:MAG: RNA polymerase sigma factor [Bacteroidales bacterium]|nr:RNA polymerase sigma factor [Bacteroidales bacterium]
MFARVSDTDIIEGIRKQDDKTLNWLYRNYLPTIKKYVLKKGGSESDSYDVFQESIIVLYRQISENSLKLTSDLKGYFFGIARNIWNAQLRIIQRHTPLEGDYEDKDDTDIEKNNIIERIIARSLEKLTPDSRMILKLFSEGYSYEEIAEKMNLKNETYARRKKYLSKESLLEIIRLDPEYHDYLNLL